MGWWKGKSVAWGAGLGLAFGGVLFGLPYFAEWCALQPGDPYSGYGYGGITMAMLPGVLLLFASPLIAVAAIISAIFRQSRHLVLPAFLFLGIFIAFLVLPMSSIAQVRHRAFVDLAARSAPLVAAIQQYADTNGKPPSALDDLVPQYVEAVPYTGIRGYPKYEFVAEPVPDEWDGNPWALYVRTPTGGPNWDIFLYLPLQNYPERGYGGGLERIGDWAYVHE